MKKIGILMFGTLAIIGCFASTSFSQMESEHYRITTSVISGGGGTISSASYDSNATLGQSSPVMDPMNPPYSASYDLYPGFWYTLNAGFESCWWDIEPESGDGDVDGSDLALYSAGTIIDLEQFADQFGRNDCPD